MGGELCASWREVAGRAWVSANGSDPRVVRQSGCGGQTRLLITSLPSVWLVRRGRPGAGVGQGVAAYGILTSAGTRTPEVVPLAVKMTSWLKSILEKSGSTP